MKEHNMSNAPGVVALPPALPERDPKEMLSFRTLPDSRTEILINHSSYTLLSECKRKAHYALQRGLRQTNESAATLFGRAIHAGLEVWYTAPRSLRQRGSSVCDDSIALMECGQSPIPHGACVRCAAIAGFLRIVEPLRGLEPSDKRSPRNGTTILDAYFDQYADDPYVVLRDSLGPVSERRVRLQLTDLPDSCVTFFGTIDVVLQNEATKHVVVTDHKTTSALGSEFLQRIAPNAQYTGYVAAFRANWPESATRTFMSNGLLVAKTKQTFARQFTEVTDEHIEEWRESLLDAAYDWWARVKAGGSYPMTTPGPCTTWGGCQYRALCESPSSIRESVIKAQYENQNKNLEGESV
jgi:hypothetical protein